MIHHRWPLWLCTRFFALLPLLFWTLLAHTPNPAEGSRELLFSALVLCTMALSDLTRVDAKRRTRVGYESLYRGSITLLAISAVLYGAFLNVHGDAEALRKLLPFSVGAAMSGLVVGICAQIFVHSAPLEQEL